MHHLSCGADTAIHCSSAAVAVSRCNTPQGLTWRSSLQNKLMQKGSSSWFIVGPRTPWMSRHMVQHMPLMLDSMISRIDIQGNTRSDSAMLKQWTASLECCHAVQESLRGWALQTDVTCLQGLIYSRFRTKHNDFCDIYIQAFLWEWSFIWRPSELWNLQQGILELRPYTEHTHVERSYVPLMVSQATEPPALFSGLNCIGGAAKSEVSKRRPSRSAVSVRVPKVLSAIGGLAKAAKKSHKGYPWFKLSVQIRLSWSYHTCLGHVHLIEIFSQSCQIVAL